MAGAARRLAAVVAAALAPVPAAAEGGLSVYVGRFSTNHWEEFFLDPGGITYKDAWLAVVAPSWRVARPLPKLSVEVEGQLGRYVGDQSNWEINALVAARYRLSGGGGAPLRASLAFGLGPSWASHRPALEKTLNDEHETRRWMVYWYLEGTVAPRSWQHWSVLVRLHHRSGAYGQVAEEGGANVPSLGVRRRF